MLDICQYRTSTIYQYGTSTGLPVLKIVIMPDICQYRTSKKCQHRQPVRDQHWQTSAEHHYHPQHMPVHQYCLPALRPHLSVYGLSTAPVVNSLLGNAWSLSANLACPILKEISLKKLILSWTDLDRVYEANWKTMEALGRHSETNYTKNQGWMFRLLLRVARFLACSYS